MSRRRAVQCRPLRLVPRLRDLGALEQGKYEEERKSFTEKRRRTWRIYRCCGARAPSFCLGLQFQAALDAQPQKHLVNCDVSGGQGCQRLKSNSPHQAIQQLLELIVSCRKRNGIL